MFKIKGYIPPPRKEKPESKSPAPKDESTSFSQVMRLAQELEDIKAEHEKVLSETKEEHKAKLAELDEAIAKVHETASTMQKGEPGKDAPVLNPEIEARIVRTVQSKVRVPRDGVSPVLDEVKIAKIAAKYVPKPRDGKQGMPGRTAEVNHDEIVDKVFGALDSGKKKLSTKHIGDFTDGLEQTIAPIRNLAAGFRGGGDTVGAGTNVTITTVNGTKVISAIGSSTTVYSETPTGLVNGSNKVYTVLHTINTVIGMWINGQFIHPSEYATAGAGFTMVTALDASLSGTGFTISYT